ncbi:hypothetical protein J6590_094598 [Homalodisca vitripennis]|nr:hypothetical protein J6590_094598 [Homalodisca vitripennis]
MLMWAERTVPRAYLHEEVGGKEHSVPKMFVTVITIMIDYSGSESVCTRAGGRTRTSSFKNSERFRERLYTTSGKTRTLSSVNLMLYWTTNSGWIESEVFYERVAYLFNNFLGKITNSVPELWGIGPPTPDGQSQKCSTNAWHICSTTFLVKSLGL